MQVRVCPPLGQGSDTPWGTTELEGRGQTGWISECILIGDEHILTFYVSAKFERKGREFSLNYFLQLK